MGRVEFIDVEHDRLWIVGWEPPLRTWFASHEPWPPTPAGEDALVDVMGTRYGEVGDLAELLTRLHDEYRCVPPVEAQRALPAMQSYNDVVLMWSQDMIGAPPWRVGTEQQRWDGYLDLTTSDPDTGMSVLRNLVGARTHDELRHREDTFVGYRGATLRTHGLPASFDLEGLQSIHRHLFQDVYPWAGELRTVGIEKGGRGFARYDQIEDSFAQLGEFLTEFDNLRSIPPASYANTLARVYHVVNTTHAFREGNGRTQREFLTALAREAGYRIDWRAVHGSVNDRASNKARQGDLGPMTQMFARIVHRDASGAAQAATSSASAAVSAAYPKAATQATTTTPGNTVAAPYRPPQRGQGPDLAR